MGPLPQNNSQLDGRWPTQAHISDLFLKATADLQQILPIDRGLLAVKEGSGTRFVATATFSERRVRRNLSLHIPEFSSLFLKVVEGGVLYSDECCEFFSGNRFERNLLIDEETRSYLIIPLKSRAETVAVVGYSSRTTGAFATFESANLTDTLRPLSQCIAQQAGVGRTH